MRCLFVRAAAHSLEPALQPVFDVGPHDAHDYERGCQSEQRAADDIVREVLVVEHARDPDAGAERGGDSRQNRAGRRARIHGVVEVEEVREGAEGGGGVARREALPRVRHGPRAVQVVPELVPSEALVEVGPRAANDVFDVFGQHDAEGVRHDGAEQEHLVRGPLDLSVSVEQRPDECVDAQQHDQQQPVADGARLMRPAEARVAQGHIHDARGLRDSGNAEAAAHGQCSAQPPEHNGINFRAK